MKTEPEYFRMGGHDVLFCGISKRNNATIVMGL
jgi:hypothetical protein